MSETTVPQTNDQLILIAGQSGTGKSASLRNIRNQERWLYLNTEAGKRLPFKNNFRTARVTDPYSVLSTFDWAMQPENASKVDGIIIDSLTFLMEQYESQYVLNSDNTMKGWSNFQQFFKELMQQKVTPFGKPVIFTAHVFPVLNESTGVWEVSVPIKGALKNNGIESYFSCVVHSKALPLADLKGYNNSLLTITEDEEIDGLKYVFQTRKTKNTTGSRIRGPIGLFSREETFIDNDAQVLLDHLNEYYRGTSEN